MQQYADVITDLKGNVVPGALVSILNLDGSLASLFATNGSTAIGNPVTTDSTGYFVFRAANGNYKRRVTAAGVSFDIPGEIVLYASGNEAVAASEISNTPTGNVNGTTVQLAINELESEKVPFFLLNSPSGAAQVGTTPAGSLSSANVQAALNELDAEKVSTSALAGATGSDMVGHGAATVGDAIDSKASLTQLAAASGAALVKAITAGTGAVAHTLEDILREKVSVFRFMTDAQIADVRAGTALLDVTAACQAALTAYKNVEFPHHGKYKLTAQLVPQSGSTITGGGKSPVYPYDIETYTDSFGTELRVTNFAAFNLNGRTGVKISGFGVKATGGGVSAYGAAANYVAGAMGVDLTGSTLCEVRDVSFHGLEYGWAISHTTNGASTFFPTLYDYTAQDCKAVVKIGNATSVNTRVQDPAIGACAIALHCNQMLDVNWGDGLRLNDSRYFQAYGNSVYIKNTPFVTMTGVTAFEALGDTITLENCHYPVLSGVTASRAGGYVAAQPWASHRGISLINCTDAVVNGVIEHPSESALYISGCNGVKADIAISEPFYTNGMLSAGTVLGAVTVLGSSNINVDITTSGTGYLYSLASDYASSLTMVGKVGSDSYAGVYRGFDLANPALAMVSELAADTLIGAAGSVVVATKRIFVPTGKSIVSRAFHMTSPSVTLRIGAAFWTAGLTVEADGGNTSFEKKVIYTNAGGDAFYSVAVQLYNPTGSSVTVPAGHKTMISFAIE